ncbi:hypothetical protein N7532_001151 [Penicillium argentinense]|uniref:TauD/TfdA-like domain-containing protein n=1 Tax=Penicillium argentinense TaxID=1131581 RepID=A0A9W9G256_9EURO|nr:uncharacterized protein N7532_001151 [Penicillium argentinense]KAJ5110616.1 hypothetical protein N7532_001151 [Penicillium argentinense]
MGKEESDKLIRELFNVIEKPQHRVTVDRKDETDMTILDNSSVMHRATGRAYEGKYRRDMRYETHDCEVYEQYKVRAGGDGADWRVGLP